MRRREILWWRLKMWVLHIPLITAIGTTVGLVVLVLVIGVAWDRHEEVDWGNAPAWVSAAGALATGVGVLLAWKQMRYNMAVRRDDEAIQARLIHVKTVWPVSGDDSKRLEGLEVTNQSREPIRSVSVNLRYSVAVHSSEFLTRDALEAGQSIRYSPLSLAKSQGWITPPKFTYRVLFTDAAGRHWSISPWHLEEPERLLVGRDRVRIGTVWYAARRWCLKAVGHLRS